MFLVLLFDVETKSKEIACQGKFNTIYNFRVMIPDKNFPEFGEAYNCKKGEDEMYPVEEETCRVW